MKKLLMPFLLTSSLSATPTPEIDIQQVIQVLDYIKDENKQLSEVFPVLHEQALTSLDEPYPFMAIETMLDSLRYIAERYKAYVKNLEECYEQKKDE